MKDNRAKTNAAFKGLGFSVGTEIEEYTLVGIVDGIMRQAPNVKHVAYKVTYAPKRSELGIKAFTSDAEYIAWMESLPAHQYIGARHQ
jgi:hypothetical protein